MTSINWERESGEAIEEFVAAALILQNGAGCRITPSRGDGGYDVLLPLGTDRWHVVQVKRYARPLVSKEVKAIEQSFRRFEGEDVLDLGLSVTRWTLAMPLDPSRERLAWLRTLPTRNPDLVVDWMGRANLDILASENQRLVEYYVGNGRERTEHLLQQVLDARSTPTEGEPFHVLEGLVDQFVGISRVLDDIDPFYRYELAMLDGGMPDVSDMPTHAEGAAYVRFHTTAGGITTRLRIIPRSPVSTFFRPIRSTLTLTAEPGTVEHEQILAFDQFGAPFLDIRGDFTETTGPPGTASDGQGLVSFLATESDDLPLFELVLQADDGVERVLPLLPARLSAAPDGAGFWLEATDANRHVKVEVKGRRDSGETSLVLTSTAPVGVRAGALIAAAQFMIAVQGGGALSLRVAGGRTAAGPFNPRPGDAGHALWVAVGLYVRLQAHTDDAVVIPDLETVPHEQLHYLHLVVSMLDGLVVEGQWQRIDGDDFVDAQPRTESFTALSREEIVMPLAGVEVHLDHVIIKEFEDCRIERGMNPANPSGFVLVPGNSDRVTMTAVTRRSLDD